MPFLSQQDTAKLLPVLFGGDERSFEQICAAFAAAFSPQITFQALCSVVNLLEVRCWRNSTLQRRNALSEFFLKRATCFANASAA